MENKYSISEYQIFRELRYFSLIQKEVNFGIFFTYPLNISVPAGTGQEAIAQAESLALDVMLMDISILDLIGIEANQKILSILTERFLPVQEPSSPLQEGFSALREGDSLIRGRFFPFRETFSPVRWAFFPGVVFFLGRDLVYWLWITPL